jgi:hypothetical protein
MNIQSADLSSYLISYKGHGMIEHASSSNSIGHVVNHEQRHLAQFENRARFRNQEIISEDINISYKLIDGKIIAVAGKATAVVKDKLSDNQSTSSTSNSQSGPPRTDSADSQKPGVDNRIDQLMNKIEAALSTINNRLEGITQFTKQEPTGDSSADRSRLEIKKQKLEAKMAELKAKKLELTSREILGGLAELVDDSANLLSAIYKLKSGNENRSSTDEYSKIEVPEYSMQYTGLMLNTMI